MKFALLKKTIDGNTLRYLSGEEINVQLSLFLQKIGTDKSFKTRHQKSLRSVVCDIFKKIPFDPKIGIARQENCNGNELD